MWLLIAGDVVSIGRSEESFAAQAPRRMTTALRVQKTNRCNSLSPNSLGWMIESHVGYL